MLVAVVLRRGQRPPAGELRWVLAITAAAFAARLVCGVWGPIHANGQGPLWIRGALEPAALAAYGPGYFELFGWVARAGAHPDRAIFLANAALAGLAPALLYGTARAVGVAHPGALAVGLVLAADPVSLRTAASEGYFAPLGALLLGVQAALALSARALRRGDRPAMLGAVAAACLLAVSAARTHPVAYMPLAISPLLVLCGAVPSAGRQRLRLAAGVAAALATAVLLTSGAVLVDVVRQSPSRGDLLANAGAPYAVLLVALLAAAWSARRWARPPGLPIFGVVSLVVMLATRDTLVASLQKVAYQDFFLPGVLLGVAPMLPSRRARAVGCAAAIVAALLAWTWPALSHPTTDQLEYRFLQSALRQMPPECGLAAVTVVGKRVWAIPGYLLPWSPAPPARYLKLERPSDLTDAIVSNGCLLYVRSSLCSSDAARGLCESVERAVAREPLAGASFPAVPSVGDLPYDRPQVDVVVFRVRQLAPEPGGGTPTLSAAGGLTPAFAQALYDRLTPLREADGCRVLRLDTTAAGIAVGVQQRGGAERLVTV
ncbi:MAG: hypothetical protein ACRERC_15705, partial [Candidatus Binatia bacterium]